MTNKNLLITGGSTRIGRELALHFSKKGWNIAIHYFRSSSKAKILKKNLEENSIKVVLIKADLRREKQVKKVCKAIFTRRGGGAICAIPPPLFVILTIKQFSWLGKCYHWTFW